MKKLTKVILGMFLAVTFGTLLGGNSVDASERSVGNRYDGRHVVIRSVLNPSRVVEFSAANYKYAVINNYIGTGGGWNQRWRMTYRAAEDAYIFVTGADMALRRGFLGATNSFSTRGHRYAGSELVSAEAMQWRLIPSGEHESGSVYILENVAHGTVLDVKDNRIDLDQNLIVFPRHGRNNQRFILDVR